MTIIRSKYRRVIEAGKSSLMITVPREWAEEMGWQKGNFVKVWQEGNKLLVEKAE